MLPKNARRTPVVQAVRADLKPYFHAAKRFLIFGVVAEISLLAASYYGFRELNNSIETRHYFAKNYPTILEEYGQIFSKC
ncbi:uncharacterized protein LOC117646588 isoform X2 [Thrips palmi]|uniref:Uncharacterized protein LOC117646588 isoform X2 n=1 Tax=Thrips palmi TaxID=161013 RepID=A0A6P8YTZ1_THRPL|nr:uncharacterized protein LOC117646588 isoform X2 [Thrips palmi]